MAKDNHHYVPQGYLRGFAIEGEKSLIWEYDKETGDISHQPRSVREICSDYHYYAQKREDGSVDNESMENAFHEIEDKVPRIIRNIKFPGTGKKVPLSDEERVILCFFTVLQLVRVPNFRNGIEELHRKLAQITLDQIVTNDKKNGVLPAEVEEIYSRGGIKIDVERFVSLKPMVKLAGQGCMKLFEKVCHFAAPVEGMTFITSDNPVHFQVPEEYQEQFGSSLGPLHPLSELTLPLRKDLLLILSPAIKYTVKQYDLLNCTAVQLDKPDTKNINKRTALAAVRYVYTSEHSKALARMVSKFKGISQRVVVY